MKISSIPVSYTHLDVYKRQAAILSNENIFVMTEDRATTQDIRPLKIAIFNVMPTKITTETQLLRLLSNTPLQVDITLVHPQSYLSTHTPLEHLKTFYKTFEQIQSEKFDGMIDVYKRQPWQLSPFSLLCLIVCFCGVIDCLLYTSVLFCNWQAEPILMGTQSPEHHIDPLAARQGSLA